MVKFLQLSILGVFLLCGICPQKAMADSSGPFCFMDASGNTVSVWNAIQGGNFVVVASQLPAGETSWTTAVNFSDTIGSNTFSNPPTLYHTSAGDAIVLWQYLLFDTGNNFIAAATLPVGASSWNIVVISTADEDANYNDMRLAFNDSGDLLALWTATISGEPILRMSSSTIATSTVWSTPVSFGSRIIP